MQKVNLQANSLHATNLIHVIMLTGLLVASSAAAAASADPVKLALVPGGEAGEASVRVVDKTAGGMTLELDLPYLEQSQVEIDGQTFATLNIPGGALGGHLGQAELPTLTRLVALPATAAVQVRVLSQETTSLTAAELAGLKLAPSQPRDGKTVALDTSYYSSGTATEISVAVGEPALLHGLRVVPVTFQPVAYDPVSGVAEVAHRLIVQVSFEGSDLRNVASRPAGRLIPQSFANM